MYQPVLVESNPLGLQIRLVQQKKIDYVIKLSIKNRILII